MYRYADMYCNYVFLFSTQVAYLCKPEEIKSLNLNLANSADDKLMIFLNFFPNIKIPQFMQILSTGDNLY